MEHLEGGNLVFHATGDQAHVPHLLQNVDAESPLLFLVLQHVGEVDAAVFLEDSLPPFLHADHGEDQPDHFLVVHQPAVQRPQNAIDAHVRRKADLQVQVASAEFDHGPKQLIDFQLLVLSQERLWFDLGR